MSPSVFVTDCYPVYIVLVYMSPSVFVTDCYPVYIVLVCMSPSVFGVFGEAVDLLSYNVYSCIDTQEMLTLCSITLLLITELN